MTAPISGMAQEGERIFGPVKYWRRNRTDLGADGRARVHDRAIRYDVALHRVRESPVLAEMMISRQIGADSEIAWECREHRPSTASECSRRRRRENPLKTPPIKATSRITQIESL